MYKRKTLSAVSKPVSVKPTPTSTPAIISVNLEPIFLQIRLPKNAPKQKKHIASVKFNASDESLQLKTSLKGTFKIDQAYKTPEKSIVKTPTAR
jgi:hypothetical protein